MVSYISDELATFLNVSNTDKINKKEVIKRVATYIHENKLVNKDNKRTIEPDDKLSKILDPIHGLTLSNFDNLLIVKHFIPDNLFTQNKILQKELEKLQQKIKENEVSIIKEESKLKEIKEYVSQIEEEKLEEEISKINSIYEEILKLNYLISISDFIDIHDMEEIIIISENHTKLFSYKLQQDECLKNTDVKERYNKLMQINNDINILEKEVNKPIYSKIVSSWNKMFHSKLIYNNHKPIEIKALEIIKFNVDKKKRLKEIYEKWHNEEYIKKLLAELYERDILYTLEKIKE